MSAPRWTLTTGAVTSTSDAARLYPDGRTTATPVPCAVHEHAEASLSPAAPEVVLLNGHATAIGCVRPACESLAALGLSSAAAAALLDVSEHTVRRYRAGAPAPAAVCLLLEMWCTPKAALDRFDASRG